MSNSTNIGVLINSEHPKSKKEIKNACGMGLKHGVRVTLYPTSELGGNGYEGPVQDAPDGLYYFVGPDPYTNRKFYGTITIKDGKVKVA